MEMAFSWARIHVYPTSGGLAGRTLGELSIRPEVLSLQLPEGPTSMAAIIHPHVCRALQGPCLSQGGPSSKPRIQGPPNSLRLKSHCPANKLAMDSQWFLGIRKQLGLMLP